MTRWISCLALILVGGGAALSAVPMHVEAASNCTGPTYNSGTKNLSLTCTESTDIHELSCTDSNNPDTLTLTVNGKTETVTCPPDAPADLTASTPANVTGVVGQPITLTTTFGNLSTGGSGIPFPATILRHDSPIPTSAATIVRLFKDASALGIPNGFPGGYSEPQSGTFTPPSPGTWYYRACADSDDNNVGVVTESNEGNNCSGFARIDVTASDLTANTPANVTGVIGESITLSVTGRNIGGVTTGSPFPALFLLGSSNDPTSIVTTFSGGTARGIPNGFPAGYGEPLTYTYTPSARGTYYYRVCMDADSNWWAGALITELNEGNNCGGSGTITVVGPPNLSRPIVANPTRGAFDAALNSYSNFQLTFRTENDPGSGAESATKSAADYRVQFDNNGNGTFDAGEYDRTTTNGIPTLALGEGVTRNVTIDGPITFGSHRLRITVDSSGNPGKVSEVNENDNVYEDTITILPPDPGLTISTDKVRVRHGDTATVTWNVTTRYPMACTVTGPGVNSGTFSPETATLSASDVTDPITAKSEFNIRCVESVTGATWTDSVMVESVGQVEEI